MLRTGRFQQDVSLESDFSARSSCRFAPEAFQLSFYLAKFRFAQLVDRRHRRHINFIVSASMCNYG